MSLFRFLISGDSVNVCGSMTVIAHLPDDYHSGDDEKYVD